MPTTYDVAVIGADGANSTVRKRVGAPRFQRLSVAVEREISADRDAIQGWHDTIALDFGRLASGYAWVFPKAKNFSVGAWGPQGVARQLAPYCNEMVAHYRDRMGSDRPYIARGHYLPLRVRNEPIVFGRTLLVGDAAGLIEPLTGEGIYYAMRSGQIAARASAHSG
jgi:flavin-dependent dehydrogenase